MKNKDKQLSAASIEVEVLSLDEDPLVKAQARVDTVPSQGILTRFAGRR